MPIVIKGWTTACVQASDRLTPRCSRVQRTGLAMVSYSTVLCMPCTHVRFSFNAGLFRVVSVQTRGVLNQTSRVTDVI